MSIWSWLSWPPPPDPVTAATRQWLTTDRDARAETSAREQLAAAQCREAAARYELRLRNRMYGRASATIGAQRNLIAMQRHPSGTTDPADTATVGDEMPEGWPADRRDDDDVCDILSPDRFICTRPTGHAGQHVATAGVQVCEVWPNKHRPDVIERAEQYGHEIGQRDRTAAVEGAAITLRAHQRSRDSFDTCACGWAARGVTHVRHVAEQLAAVGALGTFAPMAAPPVLVDRDGDEWHPHPNGNGYFHPGNHLSFMPSREALAEEYGPLTEKPAHPAPRPTVRTGLFRLGPARGLADGGS